VALIGMFAWQGRAYEIGGNTYTAKADFVIPGNPIKGFAQISGSRGLAPSPVQEGPKDR
jgi:hypothetical protein